MIPNGWLAQAQPITAFMIKLKPVSKHRPGAMNSQPSIFINSINFHLRLWTEQLRYTTSTLQVVLCVIHEQNDRKLVTFFK